MVWFIVYIQSCLILYTFGVCYSLYLVGSELFMLTAAAGEVYSGRCNFAPKCQLAKLYQPIPFRGLPYGEGSVTVSGANLEKRITATGRSAGAFRGLGRAGVLITRCRFLYFLGLPKLHFHPTLSQSHDTNCRTS